MSARYDNRGETPTITRRRHVLACARCRARRVKCDRAQPACSNCVKAGALCQPAQQQPVSSQNAVPTRSGNREPSDRGRLSKLEDEVARLSREVSDPPSREPSLPPSPGNASDGRHIDLQGKLLPAPGSSYFSPLSWAVVADEVTDIDTISGIFGDLNLSGSAPQEAMSNETDDVSRPNDQLHDILINIFRQRVDPLVRVMHWPTFFERCRNYRHKSSSQNPTPPAPQYAGGFYSEASFDPSQQLYTHSTALQSQSQTPYTNISASASTDAAFSALLYSVYYAAFVSIIDSPNPPDLGQNMNIFNMGTVFKREVTNRVMALHEGIAKAASVEMLQAMVLTLSMDVSSFDLQLQWLQIGAAIRMAQALGVHRDGSNFDLGPIEIEIRRRVWAQLCVLDTRCAEQLGREPTISIDSFDTMLPLSIDDRDLTEIEEQDAAARQGQDTTFKSHQEVEQSQERSSPFSPMTFSLVQAETARVLAQLISVRYRARDAARMSVRGESRTDKAHWVSRLEHRFQIAYGLGSLTSSSPMQSLVSEVASLNIAKVRFVHRMIEWKEGYNAMNVPARDSETTSLFRDATTLALRSLSLIHQYSTSPYSWYTKRLRDVYTSAYLALNLVSGQHIPPGDMNSAWSVLDQLFPADASGRLAEHGVARSAFGKVLMRARMRRQYQPTATNAHEFRGQALQSAASSEHHGFTASLAPHPTLPLTSSAGEVGSFPSTGNLFEDFDAIMQDPLWSPGMPGMDNQYGSWAVSSPSIRLPLRHLPQPYEQPPTFRQPALRTATPFLVPQNIQRPLDGGSDTDTNSYTETVRTSPVPSVRVDSTGLIRQSASPDISRVGAQMVLEDHRHISESSQEQSLSPPKTWPPAQIHTTSQKSRDRSISQPEQPHYLSVQQLKRARTISMTYDAPRPNHAMIVRPASVNLSISMPQERLSFPLFVDMAM